MARQMPTKEKVFEFAQRGVTRKEINSRFSEHYRIAQSFTDELVKEGRLEIIDGFYGTIGWGVWEEILYALQNDVKMRPWVKEIIGTQERTLTFYVDVMGDLQIVEME